MSEVLRIRADQLKKKIGEIAPKGYLGHTVNSFMGGIIPVQIKTDMCQSDFDKFSDGELSDKDIVRLKLCGIL